MRFSTRLRAALLLCGGAVAFGADARAQLEFPQRTVELRAGADDRVLTAKFPFRNAGADPIAILAIETSCGCVKASSARLDFGAGEGGEIVADFSLGLAGGALKQTVTVMTSETPVGRHVLEIRATVPAREAAAAPPAVVISPTQLTWVRAPFAAKRVTIDLAAAQAESAEVSAEPAAAFEVTAEPLDEARRMKVSVTPRGSGEAQSGVLVVILKSAGGAKVEQRVPLRLPGGR